ncbi:MAG TPA: hypothetical protein VF466_01510 [Candidatus Saccharimonadales bacterium]
MSGEQLAGVPEPLDLIAAQAEAIAGAAVVADRLAERLGTLAGRRLDADERSQVFADILVDYMHFDELARQAGELAESNDILGAISLLGGEENARSILGDSEVDRLIAWASAQMIGEVQADGPEA